MKLDCRWIPEEEKLTNVYRIYDINVKECIVLEWIKRWIFHKYNCYLRPNVEISNK